MLKSLRWRIAVWFLCLSTLVYITSTLLGMWIFSESMTNALDFQLKVFGASIGRAIDLRGTIPYFRDWARTVQTEPARGMVTIQIFDKSGNLLEEYGPPGYRELVRDNRKQVAFGPTSRRVLDSPLKKNGQLIGYLQLQLPTKNVEDAVRQFGITMALVAPFVVIGLTGTSLLVSRKVMRPFDEQVRLLKRFVSDASHELNSPLSIIQARNESLAKKLANQGLPTDDSESISRTTERMGKIIGDLMLLAEVEGPMSAGAKSTVDLQSIAAVAAEEFGQRFADKGVKLICETSDGAEMKGYADALHRLVLNLLENALRFTEPGGSATISVKVEERAVKLVVQDTGIGIPPESMPFVFDRFYRVDKSRTRASGGSGLGLSIVKAIAEAHDGQVFLTSELGRGSQFSVIFRV